MPGLTINDKFPNLKGVTQSSTDFDLYEYLGDSWAMMFMHPGDYTPVCTTEIGAFAQRQAEFEARGIKLCGFSCNDADSHRGWIEDIVSLYQLKDKGGVTYPLFCDPARDHAVELGVLDETNKDKAGLPMPVRSVFILKPDKTIALSITYPASTGRNVDEILRVIDSLIMAETKGVATPVDWKQGDDVIVSFGLSNAAADKKFGTGGYRVVDVPSESGKKVAKNYLRYTEDPSLKSDVAAVIAGTDKASPAPESAAVAAAVAAAPAKAKTATKAPPGGVTATVTKQSADDKVGIGVKETKDPAGHLYISKILPDGLFGDTPLRAGMWLLTVDGAPADSLSKEEGIDLFKKAEGTFSVTAVDVIPEGLVKATVMKPEIDSKLGIGLNELKDGTLFVSSIAKGGLFYQTQLRVGMHVKKIDGDDCTTMARHDAIEKLRDAEGSLTVIAAEVPGKAVAKAKKETKASKVGVGVKERNGCLYISSIALGGLFDETALRVGMYLLSVNNTWCKGLSAKEGIALFKNAEGDIKVYASADLPDWDDKKKGGLFGSMRQSTRA